MRGVFRGILVVVLLGACVPQRTVGGTLSGFEPTLGTVAVTLNGGAALELSANGAFTFPKTLAQGSLYQVEVTRAPSHQDCVVEGGSGKVDANVSVTVRCALQKYLLGGTLVGVDKDGLTILEMVSNQQVQPDAGAVRFEFPAALEYRKTWAVALATMPEGRDCELDGGSGAMDASVAPVFVRCTPQRFAVSGEVVGLSSGQVTVLERTSQQSLSLDGGPFIFPQTLEWDTNVRVEVSGQPAGSFCRVDGGAGVVRAPKTDVEVSCKPGSSVGGLVYGLGGGGVVLRELTTAQTLRVVSDGGSGPADFTLSISVPNGEPYQVTIDAPPPNERCRVVSGAGIVSADVHDVQVFCNGAYSDLVVSEVSGATTPSTPAWIELFNATATVKNLADYSLRSGLIQSDGGVMAQNDFLLPDASVAPYGFIVVSGKPFADLYDGPSLKRLGSPSATLYFVADGGPGAVQLRSSGGVPVDTVVFGAFSAPGWQGAPASLPAEFGRTLARRLEQGDTDTAADFAGVDVATPGGPNDAFDATDSDGDGIPDSAERPGGQLAGLPLYDWGARTNQRDVFVEVDWMKPDGGSGFDPGLLPRRDALQRVTDVMLTHGIHLHFDVGALFGAGVMDLGGGNELPFGCTLTLAGTVGPTSLFALKAAAFDLRRLASFHYLVFGNSLADVACGGVGATGRAELPGDDVAITLGNRGYAVSPVNQLNRLVNAMSSTVMHELGHNFGLRHGGDVDANFKPNYLSVMNYLYQLEGLPQIGTAEGDRYYYFYGGLYGLCAGPPAIASRNSLTRNAFSAPGVFSLDYSDGKSLPLDKAALDETKGMGRAGSTAVDWSYDGAIQAGAVSANVDALGSALPVCPRNSPSTGVVTDHDDWAALKLPFNRTPLGSALGKRAPRSPRAGIDLIGDHQPWSIEAPLP